jgi:hypothetical protein
MRNLEQEVKKQKFQKQKKFEETEVIQRERASRKKEKDAENSNLQDEIEMRKLKRSKLLKNPSYSQN